MRNKFYWFGDPFGDRGAGFFVWAEGQTWSGWEMRWIYILVT